MGTKKLRKAVKRQRKVKPLTDKDGEVRELTKADFAEMRPFKEIFPKLYAAWRPKKGRTVKKVSKTKKLRR